VLVKRDGGASEGGLDDFVGARNLFRRDGDNAHETVKAEAEPCEARSDLALASDGHAEAEDGRGVVPETKGAQECVLAGD
jgi:hypothetical protein